DCWATPKRVSRSVVNSPPPRPAPSMDRTNMLRVIEAANDPDAGTPLGQHVLLDLWDVPAADDDQVLEGAIVAAVAAMDATLLDLRLHRFKPQGLTALAMLSESHLAVHTWPEQQYV